MEYPIRKFGARWICDGPFGRFHTRTKREAEAQLAEDLDHAGPASVPPEPYWTVVWDYIGGDCGDLPGRLNTEADAEAYGEAWVNDTLADMRRVGDLVDEGDDGYPVFHVVAHSPDAQGLS